MSFILTYLRGDLPLMLASLRKTAPIEVDRPLFDPGTSEDLTMEISDIRGQLELLISDVEIRTWKASGIGASEKEEILSSLRNDIKKGLSSEFLSTIEAKYGTDVLSSAQIDSLGRKYKTIAHRLANEVHGLTRRANLNLALGTLTTSAAVAILAYMVLGNDGKFEEYPQLLSYYVPRISLVVFIEVFSFFFLRLYKANLAETKYFQNELTNVDLRFVALESSLLLGDETCTREILTGLAATERNFLLKKDESTVELQRLRIEQEGLQELTSKVATLLGRNQKR